jgi:hypothetical protein
MLAKKKELLSRNESKLRKKNNKRERCKQVSFEKKKKVGLNYESLDGFKQRIKKK